ncbi:unnamed protein product [Protopolystoma xenopodis]|uniref:Uncharacterized protein n=1 Tax=Protopolystoma xenopodis TaxID=117903 RepID=A0A448WCR3_9PLAT|nr:unnamed protein product [Protopolystoma xenopodis]
MTCLGLFHSADPYANGQLIHSACNSSTRRQAICQATPTSGYLSKLQQLSHQRNGHPQTPDSQAQTNEQKQQLSERENMNDTKLVAWSSFANWSCQTGFSLGLLPGSDLSVLSEKRRTSAQLKHILPACYRLVRPRESVTWEKAEGRDSLYWRHRIPKEGYLGLLPVKLCEEDLNSLSYDPDDSVLSFRPSCDGHRSSQNDHQKTYTKKEAAALRGAAEHSLFRFSCISTEYLYALAYNLVYSQSAIKMCKSVHPDARLPYVASAFEASFFRAWLRHPVQLGGAGLSANQSVWLGLRVPACPRCYGELEGH